MSAPTKLTSIVKRLKHLLNENEGEFIFDIFEDHDTENEDSCYHVDIEVSSCYDDDDDTPKTIEFILYDPNSEEVARFDYSAEIMTDNDELLTILVRILIECIDADIIQKQIEMTRSLNRHRNIIRTLKGSF